MFPSIFLFPIKRLFSLKKQPINKYLRNYNCTTLLSELGSSLVSDIMLQDVGKQDLNFISEKLGVKYLETVKGNEPPQYPVNGIIWGNRTNRCFVNLIIQKIEIKLNVLFLVNTGSPDTFISSEALEKLGFKDNIPLVTTVTIHGNESFNVYASPRNSHFSEVNVLGQDFFTANSRQFLMSMKSKPYIVKID